MSGSTWPSAFRTASLRFERTAETEPLFAPAATTVITLKQKSKGTPYWQRPDWGIGPDDVKVEGATVRVRVHSLGSIAAPATTVELRDRSGKAIASAAVPSLEAPNDLTPRSIAATLVVPAGADLQGPQSRSALEENSTKSSGEITGSASNGARPLYDKRRRYPEPELTMSSSLAAAEFVVRTMADTVLEHEVYFGQLDSVVGDGDFGYSLARGFEIVKGDLASFDRSSIAAFLRKVGMVIASRVGGTSGPLWGTAFMRAAGAAANKTELTSADLVAMLRAAVAGIQQRGGASLGEKTLLDALVPAIDRLEQDAADGVADGGRLLAGMAHAARQAADATTNMIAKRGRASYTGERSIGSPDAGAVAIAVLAESLAARWPEFSAS